MKKIRTIAIAAFIMLFTVAEGAIVNLNSVQDGSYQYNNGTGVYTRSADDISGLVPVREARSGFIFDLSSVSENIVSATLQLNFQASSGVYQLTVYDVTSDVNDLIAGTGPLSQYFDDLGDGQAFSATQNSPLFNLNANALTDLNSHAGGLFALGVRDSAINTFYRANGASLTLTTVAPEPAEILLIILGLFTLFYFYKRENIELPA